LVEPGYLSVALPQLNIVTVNKLFSPLDGFSIIGAVEMLRAMEVPV
jgi:hypothetical protein